MKKNISASSLKEKPGPSCVPIFVRYPNWIRRMLHSTKLRVWTRAVKCPAASVMTEAVSVGTWKEVIPGCTQFVILRRACSLPEGSPHPGHPDHAYETSAENGFLYSRPGHAPSTSALCLNWFTGILNFIDLSQTLPITLMTQQFPNEGGKKSESDQTLLNWELINQSL